MQTGGEEFTSFTFQSSSGRRAQSLPGKPRSLALRRPGHVTPPTPPSARLIASPLQPPIKLSMLLPVRRTALWRFVWTVFSPARSPVRRAPALHPRLSRFKGAQAASGAGPGLQHAWRETLWTKWRPRQRSATSTPSAEASRPPKWR